MRKGKYIRESMFGPDIEGPADEIVNDAWDAETPAQMVKLARKALAVDLNAIDAYNILGIHASALAERIALFREAVRIGENLFSPAFADDEMDWWGYLGTRPWMRAQHNLGLALIEAGDTDDVIVIFKRLLALNPNDNQGIRILLLMIAAETGDYGQCKILFADYEEDGSIEFAATKLLVDIATRKKIDYAAHFKAIDDSNKHLLPLLNTAARSGKWPKRPTADMVTWGGKDAASIYLHEFKAAWQRNPKFLARFAEEYLGRQMRDAISAIRAKDKS